MNKPIQLLLLEDSADDAQLLLLQLEQDGIQVKWDRVETESDFLAALDSRPDLVLADYNLPQYNGLTALRQMHERGLDIPFIIVSGTIGEELAVECMRQGAADYLLKDRLARLGLAVERALDMACLRADQRKADEKFRWKATHDSLTDLYNRAFFDEEAARVERGRTFPISVVIADVDGLKRVNDIRGHAAGDDLLRRTAQTLRAGFRAEDVIARIGGDEFAVLLPGVTEQVAQAAVQRLRSRLLTDNQANGDPILSLSLGIATVERGVPLAEALQQADEKMYLDKSRHARASATPPVK